MCVCVYIFQLQKVPHMALHEAAHLYSENACLLMRLEHACFYIKQYTFNTVSLVHNKKYFRRQPVNILLYVKCLRILLRCM